MQTTIIVLESSLLRVIVNYFFFLRAIIEQHIKSVK